VIDRVETWLRNRSLKTWSNEMTRCTKKVKNKMLSDKGFSIVESTIAITTLGTCLAYAMPLFLYSKINNIKSEVRTGSVMVAQQIFDDIRGLPFQNIPATQSNPASPTYTIINSDGTIATSASSTTIPKSQYTVLNRRFFVRVYYCETPVGSTSECDANYKKIRVEVKDRNAEVNYASGETVYEMEAGFTNFK
jgi:type II secretory pathway pseudopilin PulG